MLGKEFQFFGMLLQVGGVYPRLISYVCLDLFEKNKKRAFLRRTKGCRDVSGISDNAHFGRRI